MSYYVENNARMGLVCLFNFNFKSFDQFNPPPPPPPEPPQILDI